MKDIALAPTTQDQEVQGVLKAALSSMEENFVALVDKAVSLKTAAAGIIDQDDLVEALGDTKVPCMVGAASKDYSGRITLLVNLPDAITFSCYLRMVAEDGVKERRSGRTYDDEDRESFGEVGNILFSAVDEVLRNKLTGNVSFRLESAPELEPGSNDGEVLPCGSLYTLLLTMKIGDFPEGHCLLTMPVGLAESMNGGPLAVAEGEAGEEEIEEEDLPTEIEGTLSVFALNDTTVKVAKEATGMVGMNIDVRPTGEIPNPSRLKDRFVFIEVPEGGDKYYQWCQRLKRANQETPIIIALGWPTKRNVLLAYKAGVDQIMGLPCRARDLVRKLGRIVQAREEGDCQESEELVT